MKATPIAITEPKKSGFLKHLDDAFDQSSCSNALSTPGRLFLIPRSFTVRKIWL